MRKQSIIIIQNSIPHYRISLYNELGKIYNLTILHCGESNMPENCNYREVLSRKFQVGLFILQTNVFKEIFKKKYDVVIAMCDLHWIINIISLFIRPRKLKFIFWGSWLNSNRILNRVKVHLAQKADANIFYCNNHKNEFLDNSSKLNELKLFVANNTFDVGNRVKSYESDKKNSILFVGSLDSRKKICESITAFNKIKNEIPSNIKFIIIGTGQDFNIINRHINFLNLQNRVELIGRINNPNILEGYYLDAIVSVSFGQAGLSVLQSFGFGVPFLTSKSAISGGEKYNIIHDYNGFLCEDNINSLSFYLKLLCQDIELAKRMGEKAYNFYSANCTIASMVNGFVDAVSYCSSK